jgi:hypothetical protein
MFASYAARLVLGENLRHMSIIRLLACQPLAVGVIHLETRRLSFQVAFGGTFPRKRGNSISPAVP